MPLAAQAASAMLLTALPQGPTESNYSVQIFAIVEDAFGHVQVASASVTVLPWPLAGNAAAVSGLVTSQLASLANVTDGLSALSTVSSLGALMQGASSATLNASSVPPDVIETSLLFRPSAASALSGSPIATGAYLQPSFAAALAASVASALGLNESSSVTISGAELVYASELVTRRRALAATAGGTGPVVGVRVLVDILTAAAAASPLTNAAGAATSNSALASSVGAAVGAAMASGAVAQALAGHSGALAALGFASASELRSALSVDPTRPTVSVSAQDDLRAANTQLRGALVDVVSAALLQIGGNASGLGGSAANATSEQLSALLQDSTIPVSAAAGASVATSLSLVTSESSELSHSTRISALDAVASLTSLMLPQNVLTGAVDAANANGGNESLAAPASIPAFPSSIASAVLGIIGNVLISFDEIVATTAASGATNSTNATLASARAQSASLSAKASTALQGLSAAVLRSHSAGDPPAHVTSGPPRAFADSLTNARRRALQANATLPSYCGPGLSMTVSRLVTGAGATLPLGQPLVPCFAAGSAVPAWVKLPPAPAVATGGRGRLCGVGDHPRHFGTDCGFPDYLGDEGVRQKRSWELRDGFGRWGGG